MGGFIKFFNEISNEEEQQIGSLGFKLAKLHNKNIPTQIGFIITKQLFLKHLNEKGIHEEINQILTKNDLEKKCFEIRELILNSKPSKEIRTEILKAYHKLDSGGGRINLNNPALNLIRVGRAKNPRINLMLSTNTPVLINSQPNVIGDDELIEQITKLWAEHFKPLNTYLRQEENLQNFETSIVVSKFLEVTKSARIKKIGNNFLIEAVQGYPYSLDVSGEKPDSYLIDSNSSQVKKVEIKKQAFLQQFDLRTKKITQKELSNEKGSRTVFYESEVKKIINLVKKINIELESINEVEIVYSSERIYVNSVKEFEENIESFQNNETGTETLKGTPTQLGSVKSKILTIPSNTEEHILLINKITPKSLTNPKTIGYLSKQDSLTNQLVNVAKYLKKPMILRINEFQNFDLNKEFILDSNSGILKEVEVKESLNSMNEQNPIMNDFNQNINEDIELVIKVKNQNSLNRVIQSLEAQNIKIQLIGNEDRLNNQELTDNFPTPNSMNQDSVNNQELNDSSQTPNSMNQTKEGFQNMFGETENINDNDNMPKQNSLIDEQNFNETSQNESNNNLENVFSQNLENNQEQGLENFNNEITNQEQNFGNSNNGIMNQENNLEKQNEVIEKINEINQTMPKNDNFSSTRGFNIGEALEKKHPEVNESNEEENFSKESKDFEVGKDLGIPTIPKHLIKEAETEDEDYY